MFQNLVTPTDYLLAMWGNQCSERLGIGSDIVVVVREALQAARRRIGPVSAISHANRSGIGWLWGRRRRWIVEGTSLRGENGMEWDSDRDGEMDAESTTVRWRKFDMKSREWGERRRGRCWQKGWWADTWRYVTRYYEQKDSIVTLPSSPLLSVGIHTSRSISVQSVRV